MATIRTRNLTKKFGELVAVDQVNLEVEDAECFGLLGPNGAGKTSLIRMITAVSPPTEGDIWVVGKDLKTSERQVKELLGVVPQIDNLDPDLTVLQNLITFARYFAIPGSEARRRSLELLKMFQLEEKQNSHLRELSGGMKRRLLVARGLINQPKIMVLDEPTIGLDPQARHLVWQKLKELKKQGVTQLLTTQNMEEAAILCDRMAIIHMGKVLVIDTPERLIARYVGNNVWEIGLAYADRDKVVSELSNAELEFEEVGNMIQIFHLDDTLAHKFKLFMARPRPATLEDVFFRLTGRLLLE
jgi:lipooligosaccharide transport system ATP-binding protein